MKCRVFQNPDGSLRIMRLNLKRADAYEGLDAETAKDPSLAGLPFVDVEESAIPSNRVRRHAWRLRDGAVVDDRTIPDRTP